MAFIPVCFWRVVAGRPAGWMVQVLPLRRHGRILRPAGGHPRLTYSTLLSLSPPGPSPHESEPDTSDDASGSAVRMPALSDPSPSQAADLSRARPEETNWLPPDTRPRPGPQAVAGCNHTLHQLCGAFAPAMSGSQAACRGCIDNTTNAQAMAAAGCVSEQRAELCDSVRAPSPTPTTPSSCKRRCEQRRRGGG